MIKLLIVGSIDGIGGAEKNIEILCEELDGNSFKVDLLFLYGEGKIGERLRVKGINVEYLKYNTSGKMKNIYNVFKKVNSEKYDCIYLWGFKVSLIFRVVAIVKGFKNIVIAQRSTDTDRGRVKSIIDSFLSKFTKKYIFNAKEAMNIFENREKIEKSKCLYIPNGIKIDEKFEKVRIKEKKILINVANLRDIKGQIYLLEAVSRLKSELKDFILIIVGEGPERKKLEAYIELKKLEENVLLIGQKDNIYNILKYGDIFILPSLREGMPNALMEAMACGLPCIATNVGAVPDLLDKQGGIVVTPKNSSEILEALRYLINDEEKLISMGLYNQKYMKKNFSVEKMVKETENLIKSIANE